MKGTACQKSAIEKPQTPKSTASSRPKTPVERRVAHQTIDHRSTTPTQLPKQVSEPKILKPAIKQSAQILNTIDVITPERSPIKMNTSESRRQLDLARLTLIKHRFGALMLGYKTRRILTRHCTIKVLRKEYYDLLSFTFGL